MSRVYSSSRQLRYRTATKRDPITQATFNLRRFVSRLSLVDAGALLLVWGNIIGLIAYPVVAGQNLGGETAQKAAAVKYVASKG